MNKIIIIVIFLGCIHCGCDDKHSHESVDLLTYNKKSFDKLNILPIPLDSSDIYYYTNESGTQDQYAAVSFISQKMDAIEVIDYISKNTQIKFNKINEGYANIKKINKDIRVFESWKKIKPINEAYYEFKSIDGIITFYGSDHSHRFYIFLDYK